MRIKLFDDNVNISIDCSTKIDCVKLSNIYHDYSTHNNLYHITSHCLADKNHILSAYLLPSFL